MVFQISDLMFFELRKSDLLIENFRSLPMLPPVGLLLPGAVALNASYLYVLIALVRQVIFANASPNGRSV
jgi:hypothetical protein